MPNSCSAGLGRERRRWARNASSPENARRLVGWLNEENDEPDPSPDETDPDSWWRTIRPGSQVRAYYSGSDDVIEGTLVGPVWQDGIKYSVNFPGQGRALAANDQLLPQGPAFDWQVWQSSTGRDQELLTESDY